MDIVYATIYLLKEKSLHLGRISSEILLKVSKIGCEIVLSKSAPTKLALQLAHDLGITVVGFIRNESCNIYTHPHRIDGYRSNKITPRLRSYFSYENVIY